MRKRQGLKVTPSERQELNKRLKSRKAAAGDVKRARLILLLAAGWTWEAITTALGCSPAYVARWKSRFDEERLAGLYPRHKGKKATVLTPKTQARILATTHKKPQDGSNALEHAEVGQATWGESHGGGPHVAASGDQASPDEGVYGVQ